MGNFLKTLSHFCSFNRTWNLEGIAVKMFSVIQSAMHHLLLLMDKKQDLLLPRMEGLSLNNFQNNDEF